MRHLNLGLKMLPVVTQNAKLKFKNTVSILPFYELETTEIIGKKKPYKSHKNAIYKGL